MPNVKLPTGVDLYYETHGKGEPLIFIPSTAYSGEVWKPYQLPLAESMQLVFHDPRGCGRSVPTQSVYTIEQMAMGGGEDPNAPQGGLGQGSNQMRPSESTEPTMSAQSQGLANVGGGRAGSMRGKLQNNRKAAMQNA